MQTFLPLVSILNFNNKLEDGFLLAFSANEFAKGTKSELGDFSQTKMNFLEHRIEHVGVSLVLAHGLKHLGFTNFSYRFENFLYELCSVGSALCFHWRNPNLMHELLSCLCRARRERRHSACLRKRTKRRVSIILLM